MGKFRNYDKYDVYEDGRIWSYSHKKFLKPQTTKDGYKRVYLTDNEGKIKWYYLHRVVWESVTGEQIPEVMQVNHIDEDKTNNHINNLNLMTCKENINYSTGNERRSKSMTNNPKRSKYVGAYKDGNLVLSFPSTKECGRNGFNQGSVASCCRGERKSHKGYEWRYL